MYATGTRSSKTRYMYMYSHILFIIITCQWSQDINLYFQHEPVRVIEIDFRHLKPSIESVSIASGLPTSKKRKIVPPPTPEEQKVFLKGLQELYPQSAVLTATMQQELPASKSITHLPATIASLFDPKYKELSSAHLQVECERIFTNDLKVTKEEAKFLAESTKLQSRSLVWHEHRMGRLTASKFGAICHTNYDSPSHSLVTSILNQQQLSTPALR